MADDPIPDLDDDIVLTLIRVLQSLPLGDTISFEALMQLLQSLLAPAVVDTIVGADLAAESLDGAGSLLDTAKDTDVSDIAIGSVLSDLPETDVTNVGLADVPNIFGVPTDLGNVVDGLTDDIVDAPADLNGLGNLETVLDVAPEVDGLVSNVLDVPTNLGNVDGLIDDIVDVPVDLNHLGNLETVLDVAPEIDGLVSNVLDVSTDLGNVVDGLTDDIVDVPVDLNSLGNLETVLDVTPEMNGLADGMIGGVAGVVDAGTGLMDNVIGDLLPQADATNLLGVELSDLTQDRLVAPLVGEIVTSSDLVGLPLPDATVFNDVISGLEQGIIPEGLDWQGILSKADLHGLDIDQLLADFPVEEFTDVYKELLEKKLSENLPVSFASEPFSVLSEAFENLLLTYDSVGVIEEAVEDTTGTPERRYYQQNFDTIPRPYSTRDNFGVALWSK